MIDSSRKQGEGFFDKAHLSQISIKLWGLHLWCPKPQMFHSHLPQFAVHGSLSCCISLGVSFVAFHSSVPPFTKQARKHTHTHRMKKKRTWERSKCCLSLDKSNNNKRDLKRNSKSSQAWVLFHIHNTCIDVSSLFMRNRILNCVTQNTITRKDYK